MSPLYSSKDAPRSPFSNALRFILFEQLLMALRAHFWTVVLKKITKLRVYANFSRKKMEMLLFWSNLEKWLLDLWCRYITQKMRQDLVFLTHLHSDHLNNFWFLYAHNCGHSLREKNHIIRVQMNFFKIFIDEKNCQKVHFFVSFWHFFKY